MLDGRRILAVVPARSGSKSIPHKNLRTLGGVSLIGRAGRTLSQVSILDARVLSTDSPEYAEEGRRYGLDAPFLRPPELSSDDAGPVETLQHAVRESERHYGTGFDVIVIAEPTSPLRVPADVEAAVRRLLETGADSVVSVSPLDTKFHPQKLLRIDGNRLGFYLEEGARIKQRQQLSGGLCFKNGVCYALTRGCVMEKGAIIPENSVPLIVDRPVVNVDEEIDFEWAEFLLRRSTP